MSIWRIEHYQSITTSASLRIKSRADIPFAPQAACPSRVNRTDGNRRAHDIRSIEMNKRRGAMAAALGVC